MCGPAPSPPPMPTIMPPPQMPVRAKKPVEEATPQLELAYSKSGMTPKDKLKSMKGGFSQFRTRSPLQIKNK